MDTSRSVVIPDKPIIFFDGVCNLCNGAVDFILRKDKRERFVFESLQSDNAQLLLGTQHTKSLEYIVVLTTAKEVLVKSKAVFFIARQLGGWVKLISFFRVLPLIFTDFVYKIIAKHRYSLFGKRSTCRLPDPNMKLRFLEGYQNN
ncbi:MAG: DCC1-like thiol-disulfide oxidoreductase family protein [Fulvivirga sp.]|uniref:thiol-disulfide oxidoreductase DCC family protein n=1 Tax=Fulvivirga sp. TaxID=1931237 RepID=UPI0032EB20AB